MSRKVENTVAISGSGENLITVQVVQLLQSNPKPRVAVTVPSRMKWKEFETHVTQLVLREELLTPEWRERFILHGLMSFSDDFSDTFSSNWERHLKKAARKVAWDHAIWSGKKINPWTHVLLEVHRLQDLECRVINEAKEAALREEEDWPEEWPMVLTQGSRWVKSFRKPKKQKAGTPKAKERQQKKKAAQMHRREARKLPRYWDHDSIKMNFFESRLDALEMIARKENQTRRDFDGYDGEWEDETARDVIIVKRITIVNEAIEKFTPGWYPKFSNFDCILLNLARDEKFWGLFPAKLKVWNKFVHLYDEAERNRKNALKQLKLVS